jgi:hypothetical protein
MDTVYIAKCRYEIQKQKVTVWYTGKYRPISHVVRLPQYAYIQKPYHLCFTY